MVSTRAIAIVLRSRRDERPAGVDANGRSIFEANPDGKDLIVQGRARTDGVSGLRRPGSGPAVLARKAIETRADANEAARKAVEGGVDAWRAFERNRGFLATQVKCSASV